MIARFTLLSLMALGALSARPLKFLPAPVDNPLKGVVPYAGSGNEERFPHSMEFRYFGFGEIMKGWGDYDWSVVEAQLEETRKRGNQSVIRIYLEYPGKNGVPGFLIKEGLKVTEWKTDGRKVVTPDYGSGLMRRAMREFIAAFGKKYDGDPRLGFITAGILGLWGEWHNYPRVELAAGKGVQSEVLKAFEKSFTKTFVLLRYPAGKNDYAYTDNREMRFGYHDDSFAWATLDTGKRDDDWFFVPKLEKAGVTGKWKRVPIGGEIRPEIWATTFTDQKTGQQQDFVECIEVTHASWLMDSGLFSARYPLDEARKKRALQEVAKLGYELHLSGAAIVEGELVITVENRGVAPFYYDWPVTVRAGQVMETDWKLSKVLPGKPVQWRLKLQAPGDVAIRVANPMKGGRDLRFANEGYEGEWLNLVP
ncbi:hypothetical protein V2O64_18505 [Verrucomicrobiaceae bacterium 227]